MSDQDIRLTVMKQRALGLRDLDLSNPSEIIDLLAKNDAEKQALEEEISLKDIQMSRKEFLEKSLLPFSWSKKQKKIVRSLIRKKRIPVVDLIRDCVDSQVTGSHEGARRALMRQKSRINKVLATKRFKWRGKDKVSDVVKIVTIKVQGKEYFEFKIDTTKCKITIRSKNQK